MKKLVFLFLLHFSFLISFSQKIDSWKIVADKIDPNNYYGETVANSAIGIASSAEPLKCKDVVLNGAYDQYGRRRVSNFLESFNLVNMYLDIDGHRIGAGDVANMQQVFIDKNSL